jgi:hypothetical protein
LWLIDRYFAAVQRFYRLKTNFGLIFPEKATEKEGSFNF